MLRGVRHLERNFRVGNLLRRIEQTQKMSDGEETGDREGDVLLAQQFQIHRLAQVLLKCESAVYVASCEDRHRGGDGFRRRVVVRIVNIVDGVAVGGDVSPEPPAFADEVGQ